MDNPIRRYARISREKRDLIIGACQRGDSVAEIANMLDVKRSSVYNIWNKFVQDGQRYALPRGGARHRRMNPAMKDHLAALLNANPLMTLGQMRESLLSEFPAIPTIDISTVSRALDGQLFSMKILSRDGDVPEARNSHEVKQRRVEFANWLVDLSVTTCLVHLDETGYCLWTRRTKGRSPRGARVRRTVHTQRSPSLNMIMATSPALNLVHYRLDSGSTTRERVQEFVTNLCEKIAENLEENHSCVIVLDGARFHHGLQIPEEWVGRIELKILPPYSPFLNPVELAHSAFKSAVKRQLSNPEVQRELAVPPPDMTAVQWRLMVLQRCGEIAMDDVTPLKCVHWYQHTLRFIPRCLANEDIV